MKKLILLVIIIAITGFFYLKEDTSETIPANDGVDTGISQTQRNPSNGSFIIDGENFTLLDGKATNDNASVRLLPENASGDLNQDGKEDSVVLLAQSGGGTGVFIYIAAFVSGPVNYRGTNAIFIGDRISPQTVNVSGGIVTLTYLDREMDDSFASEPTTQRTSQYVYQNGVFQER